MTPAPAYTAKNASAARWFARQSRSPTIPELTAAVKSNIKDSPHIRRALRGDGGGVLVTQLGYHFAYLDNACRLIALTLIATQRHIGAIGLKHEAILGQALYRPPKTLGPFIGYRPTQPHHKAQVIEFPRLLRRAGKGEIGR